MKEIIVLILVLVSLFSCSKSDVVQVSGRIENGDSIVSILVDDSIYPWISKVFFQVRSIW